MQELATYASVLNKMQVLEAGLVYFLLVFGLGFVLGSIRVPFIVPRLGKRRAELLEMPFMLIGIVFSAQFIISYFDLPLTLMAYLCVGLVALSLLIMAEILLVVAMQKGTIRQYFKRRDPISGSVYILLLIVFAAMPLIIMQSE
jgi:hypothetical protein